jgi:hypothetical protein
MSKGQINEEGYVNVAFQVGVPGERGMANLSTPHFAEHHSSTLALSQKMVNITISRVYFLPACASVFLGLVWHGRCCHWMQTKSSH